MRTGDKKHIAPGVRLIANCVDPAVQRNGSRRNTRDVAPETSPGPFLNVEGTRAGELPALAVPAACGKNDIACGKIPSHRWVGNNLHALGKDLPAGGNHGG